MSNFIPHLLSKRPLPEVEDLRKNEKENETQKRWQIALREKATEFRKALISTRQAVENDPSDATVNAFIKAVSDSAVADAYGEAAQLSVPALMQRKDARTRPAIEAALRALDARLKTEDAEAARLDARSAEHLDIPPSDAASPARQRILDAIREAESYLKQLPTMPVNQFNHALRFILGDDHCQ